MLFLEESSFRFLAANREQRKYQFDIAQKALYSNALVCLPTGLGKTLIAAVVIHNFYRWFPKGTPKISTIHEQFVGDSIKFEPVVLCHGVKTGYASTASNSLCCIS